MADGFWLNRRGISLGNLASDPSNGINGDFYYNTTIKQFRGFSNGNWGSIGGGSGQGKNYITQYIASTSSGNPNPGNGDFETGGTNGWSLANSALSNFVPTSVASPGTPFDSTHGGSAPSGNLSFSTVSSSQLAGRFSGDIASSSASVAGDMLISNAFFIDVEDQSSVLSFSFSYQAISGTLNLSGSNANTFAVWIYDVTNALWIQPAGVYNLVQVLGVGKAFGSFQASSNSTQYQIALININATSGAYTLYVDDFSVGPQAIAFGAPISDWQPYNLVIGATGSAPTLGTIIVNNAQWRRVGGNMEIMYSLQTSTAGSVGSGNYLFPLPAGYQIDTSRAPITGTLSQPNFGSADANTNSGIGGIGVVNANDPSNLVLIVNENGTTTTQQVSSTFFNTSGGGSSGTTYSFLASVPILGWGSTVDLSNDTDTRVVAFFAYDNTADATSVGNVQFADVTVDTHNGFFAGNGIYTIPVAGLYEITSQLWLSGNITPAMDINKNGGTLVSSFYQSVSNGTQSGALASVIVQCNAGDQITVSTQSGFTYSTAVSKYLQIQRISGPAVIAASEKIVAKARTDLGPSASPTVPINFSSIDFDTHGTITTGTPWFFKAPISGYYQINCATFWSGAGVDVWLYVNGVQGDLLGASGTNSAVNGSDIVKLNAGDIIDVRPGMSATVDNVSDGLTYIAINKL